MSPIERDYPVGHPSASDYKGQKYTPPRAPWSEDFKPGHPARLGANCNESDTPDGRKTATVRAKQDLDELMRVGALPPPTDPAERAAWEQKLRETGALPESGRLPEPPK